MLWKDRLPRGSKIRENKWLLNVGWISAKNDILTVKERKILHIGNNSKRCLEIIPQKKELESPRIKAAKTRMNKWIEKEKILLSDICGRICWKILQVKNQKFI